MPGEHYQSGEFQEQAEMDEKRSAVHNVKSTGEPINLLESLQRKIDGHMRETLEKKAALTAGDEEDARVAAWKRLSIWLEIRKERKRQIELGFTLDHDDEHSLRGMRYLVLRYLDKALDGSGRAATRDSMIKAAALLVAMIEKMDREAGK